MNIKVIAAGLCALGLNGAAMADQVIADDLIVTDDACFGPSCVDGEGFPVYWQVKLDSGSPTLIFEDSTTSPSADHDWRLQANSNGINGFYLRDLDAGTDPFTILANAPSSSLFVAANGRVGMRTSLPMADLHIADGFAPAIRLEQDTSGGFSPNSWDIVGRDSVFSVRDVGGNVTPFQIDNNSQNNQLALRRSGFIGMGTPTPEGKLHTKGDGVQLIYFESGDSNAVQVRFRTDSENRRFLAVNNANEVKSQIIFKDNEILFTGATDSGANRWLTIGPSGILSQGGTCNVNPCDRTFDPSYFTVPPIGERAEYMWQNMHLPAIGPTTAGEPINLTEKTTGIIHELEVAHIYIEQLHRELDGQRAINAEQAELNARLLARLDRLEAAQ